MNYASIKNCDIANGYGVRVSLFVSGCTHHCHNCFNQEAWDFNYGKPFDEAAKQEIIDLMKPDYIKGISLLGGEPMEPQNQEALLPFIRQVKQLYPDKTVWCYSGYLFDKQIIDQMVPKYEFTKPLLQLFDVMVDGKFEEDKHDLTLRFRGSSNQRIINVPQSLANNEVVLWQDPDATFYG